jgi:drug/metabolite transporter (DMT)-like permease
MTPAANASLLVNLVPIAMPFLLHFLAGEKITRSEWMETALAVGGTFALSVADFRINRAYFWGDLLCLVSMLLFAAYLALGRRYRATPTTWLYVVPLYWFAGFFCLGVAPFFVNPVKAYPPREVLWILCLALIPTVIGHSILNCALKRIRGQVVSILNLAQFIFAGVMGFFFLAETPPAAFYAASALVIAGCVIAIRGHQA